MTPRGCMGSRARAPWAPFEFATDYAVAMVEELDAQRASCPAPQATARAPHLNSSAVRPALAPALSPGDGPGAITEPGAIEFRARAWSNTVRECGAAIHPRLTLPGALC